MDKEKKVAIRLNTMAIILIILFTISIVPKTLQNDTFYTIKIGEYVVNNGITMKDPFSWHEDLEYTFPHWAYDVLTYLVYNIGGMTGVYVLTIVLACILGLSIYFTNVKLSNNKIISFALTIITMYLLKPYICARAQLVTFILFILTVFFIEKFLDTKKLRYAIILLIIPVLIANLHLATFYFYFILYLPYFAEYAVYILSYCNVIISKSIVDSIRKKIKKHGETPELLEKLNKAEKKSKSIAQKQDARMENSYKIKISYRKNTKYLIIICIVALLTGFLTPLGTTPYTYLIKTMQGISTKNINEHLPVTLANDTKLLVVFIIYIGVTGFTRSKVRFCDLCMLGGIGLLAIYSRRQSSMLYLLGILVLNRLISEIMINYNKKAIQKLEEKISSIVGIAVICFIVVICSIYQYSKKINDPYIDEISYPVQASKWIKDNLDTNIIKLYNEYNFGSYLIYEDIPVFVDSRCDLYMPEFNKDVYVFRDFLNFHSVKISDMEQRIKAYGFTHFIVSNGSKMASYLRDRPEQYKKIYPVDDIPDNNFSIFEKVNIKL